MSVIARGYYVNMRSNWGIILQKESSYIQTSVTNNSYYRVIVCKSHSLNIGVTHGMSHQKSEGLNMKATHRVSHN